MLARASQTPDSIPRHGPGSGLRCRCRGLCCGTSWTWRVDSRTSTFNPTAVANDADDAFAPRVDVLLNAASNRKNPSAVTFTDGERITGEQVTTPAA